MIKFVNKVEVDKFNVRDSGFVKSVEGNIKVESVFIKSREEDIKINSDFIKSVEGDIEVEVSVIWEVEIKVVNIG